MIIFSYLLIVILVFSLIYIKWKLPIWIGRIGENFISRKLHKLDPSHYKILNDIMLPSRGNSSTTQIDHIVISNFGIFCIETKSYKGWIFGNANQEQWTQVIFRYKVRFYNPLWQNFSHIKAIENLLGKQRLKRPIVSLVTFPDADKLQISDTNSVGHMRDIISKIQSYTEPVFSDIERDEIYNLILHANITNKKDRKSHNKDVKELLRNRL